MTTPNFRLSPFCIDTDSCRVTLVYLISTLHSGKCTAYCSSSIQRMHSIFVLTDVLYVATCNPVSLYSMKERGETIECIELYDVFPRTISGVWQPFVTVAPLGSPLDGQVVLHEEQVGRQIYTHVHKDMFA